MGTAFIDWTEPLDLPCQGGALTIGNFDGVHRGHQQLLAEVRRQGDACGGPTVALTFDPHPRTLLRPGLSPPLLTTPADRIRLLLEHGADHVVTLRTTPELLRLTARAFFDEVILGKLQPRVLVPGFNFCFGRGREGNVETLARFCTEAGLSCVPALPLHFEGEPICSTLIRTALEAGDVRRAAQMLGRPYRLSGIVARGAERGRTLGFPTVNLEEVTTVVPATGVYAGVAGVQGGTFAAAVNVGPNPTFGESARKLEAHLLDFSGDLYGATLTLEFVERLRETRAFSSPAELMEQLQRDVEETRRLIAG